MNCSQFLILGIKHYKNYVIISKSSLVFDLFKSFAPHPPKQLQIRVIFLHTFRTVQIHFPQEYQYKFKWPHLLEDKSEGGNQHLIKLWGNCCSWEDIGWHKLMLTTVDYWGYLHYYQNCRGFPNIGSTQKVR